MKKKPVAVLPGTFDPMTNAHVELVERASVLFERLVVAVARNPSKKTMFSLKKRIIMAENSLKHISGVEVIGFNQLLAHFAQSYGAVVLVRGIRGGADFDYEQQLADVNRYFNANLDTIFLVPSLKNRAISSTIVRDIALHQGDITAFVPAAVHQILMSKRA